VRLILFYFLKRNRSNCRFALLRDLEEDDSQMQVNTNELVSYYLKSMEPYGFNILNYWKRNETVYSTLVMMARDIFVVPVSTVPSESYFSLANRILTNKCSRLGIKTFKRFVCLKD
jgi:hAT family C-terminal dimerisation region